MPAIRITVGAAAEASLSTVYRPLYEATARARAYVASQAKATGAELASAHRAGAAAASRASKDGADAALGAARKRAQGEVAAIRQVQTARNRDHAEFLRGLKEETREAERAAKAREAAAKKGSKAQAASLRAIGSGAMRNLGGVARAGYGVARDVTRGLGVNFDLASSVNRSVELESLATAISNQAYRTGGKRVAASTLETEARGVGDKYALDPGSALEGLNKFYSLTGKLDVGRAGLDDLAKLSKATNTDLDAMITGAGEVSNALGDAFKTPEEKANAVVDVMKTMAAQGAEAAIEIKTLAPQMAKLAAAAGSFAGDPRENMKRMGILVQLARAGGGASSTTAAATSVAGFANTLKTPSRMKAFEEAKIDIFAHGKGQEGQFADPLTIMRRSIEKFGSDPKMLKGLFKNVVGAKPVEALSNIYKRAGGGKEGMAAVDKEIARFNVSMSDEKVNSDLKQALGTKESKAQLFQNQLDRIAASLADRLLPALEQLAPKVLALASAMGDLIGWASENPGQAITLAITGSIAKAAIGNAVGNALRGALGGAGGSLGGLGQAGLTLAIAAAALTIGMATIDMVSSETGKGVNRAVDSDAAVTNALLAYGATNRGAGPGKEKSLAQLQEAGHDLESRISAAKDPTSFLGAVFTSKTFADRGQEQNDARELGRLEQQLAQVVAAINSLKSGIPVTNMPEMIIGETRGVDSRGRSTGIAGQ